MEPTAHGHDHLTGSLEMYLKTVFARTRTHGVVRVGDLARDLGVKAPSVTAALKRLAQSGFISYVQREYVRLTSLGQERARQIEARNVVLNWFFTEVLRLPETEARENACAIEHVLSPAAMNRLVSLYEFVRACPAGEETFLERFHGCPVFEPERATTCDRSCSLPASGKLPVAAGEMGASMQLARVKPGMTGKVLRVEGSGELRQRLIEMGLLPDQVVTVERTGLRGDPMWIRFGGFQLALRKSEASLVVVRVDGR